MDDTAQNRGLIDVRRNKLAEVWQAIRDMPPASFMLGMLLIVGFLLASLGLATWILSSLSEMAAPAPAEVRLADMERSFDAAPAQAAKQYIGKPIIVDAVANSIADRDLRLESTGVMKVHAEMTSAAKLSAGQAVKLRCAEVSYSEVLAKVAFKGCHLSD